MQDFVPKFLENLTDVDLKKEAKNEAKNDALSAIIKVILKDVNPDVNTLKLRIIVFIPFLFLIDCNFKMDVINRYGHSVFKNSLLLILFCLYIFIDRH